MLMPTIDRYMTCQPWTIGPRATISAASRLMREHGIRHLPVVDGERLLGIVSERDLLWIQDLPHMDPDLAQIEDAMRTDVYVASPHDEVDRVVEQMAHHKYGCVVVKGKHRIEGIFTSVDALQVLADVLRRVAA